MLFQIKKCFFHYFLSMPQFFVMEHGFNTSTERGCGHFKSVDWVKSPVKSVKVIGFGCFRGFDSFQAGRNRGFKSGGWRKHDRNRFWDRFQMRWLFLLFQRRYKLPVSMAWMEPYVELPLHCVWLTVFVNRWYCWYIVDLDSWCCG